MNVSKSGFYHWNNKAVSKRSKQNDLILINIIRIFNRSKERYGSPRIHHELIAAGIECGVNRVARLMKLNEIHAVTSVKHKKTIKAKNTKGFTDNVLGRSFNASAPNQKWVSDTTFINTAEGWLYLAVIIDLYSRKVIGWSMSKHNNTELVSKALLMAIKTKKRDQSVLLHSDQGSQYRAKDYLALFDKNCIKQSMSEKGNCHDNAVAESFFATLKNELVYLTKYKTKDAAKSSIFEYIELFYNRIRRHSYLNYESPTDFETRYYNKA